MNKNLYVLIKKKISFITISRIIVQLIFLYFFSGLLSLAFNGLKSIYIGIVKGHLNIENSFISLGAFAAVVILTFFIGRFFCGWICAFGTFNELIYLFSKKIIDKKINIPEVVNKKLKYFKYIVLLFIIIFIWTINLSTEKSINPWDAFAELVNFKNFFIEMPLAFIFLILIVIGAVFIERFFCRYICPLGAVQALISKFKLITIIKPREKCEKCRLCSENCPMGINLSQVDTVDSGECIVCLKCVDTCYKNNPNLIILKKLNVRWYFSAAAAVLIFNFIFWGSRFIKNDDNLGSSINSAYISKSDKAIFNDGIYIGVGNGFRPNLKVQVKIVEGKISEIRIISHGETQGYYEQVFNVLPKEIIAAQSTEVDGISGATRSSEGLKQAVNNALAKSRKNKNETIKDNTNENDKNLKEEDKVINEPVKDKNQSSKSDDSPNSGIISNSNTSNNIDKDTDLSDKNSKKPSQINSNSTIPSNDNNTVVDTSKSNNSDEKSKESNINNNITNSNKGSSISTDSSSANGALNKDNVENTNKGASQPSDNSGNKNTNVNNTSAPASSNSPKVKYKDGVYTGTGAGYCSGLKLSVTIKNGKIVNINNIVNYETKEYYSIAFSIVPKEIISKQSAEVDTASGATYSSIGIMSAVKDALNKGT